MTDNHTSPFGIPDGSRSNIEELLEDFVEFDILKYGAGISINKKDLSIRILVGAKGSGKTMYLRRIADAANSDKSVHATNWVSDTPSTYDVLTFSQRFHPNLLVEMWMSLWHCSLLGSLATHILYDPALRDKLSNEAKEGLTGLLTDILPHRTPISAYQLASHFINDNHSEIAFKRLFNSPNWPQIEYWIAYDMSRLPPIYFFLDSVDERYENAPLHWMQAQLGLFYQVMQFFRDARLGGRFHIVITVRDRVMAAVFRGEHQTRYRGEPHIRILDWGKEAIQYLLENKIKRLDRSCLLYPNEKDFSNIARWLGRDKIKNGGRNIVENLEDYLIRHTRHSPRDLIILGNQLALATYRCNVEGLVLTDHDIRRIVAKEARAFGDEQIEICATQIASSTMPKLATEHQYAYAFVGPKSYYGLRVADILRTLIQRIGADRFSWDHLMTITQETLDDTDYEPQHVFSALWQNRLIGYRDHKTQSGEEIFFSEQFLDEFSLPENRFEYVFHPILIDTLDIKPVGDTPPNN